MLRPLDTVIVGRLQQTRLVDPFQSHAGERRRILAAGGPRFLGKPSKARYVWRSPNRSGPEWMSSPTAKPRVNGSMPTSLLDWEEWTR